MNKMYIVRKKGENLYFKGGSTFHEWNWSKNSPKIYHRPNQCPALRPLMYGSNEDKLEHIKLLETIEVAEVVFSDVKVFECVDVCNGITNEKKVKKVKDDIKKGKAIFNIRSKDTDIAHLTEKFMGDLLDERNNED